MEVTSTRRDIHKYKVCIYGEAGVGKTVLCSTAPKPLIISAEAGLLSLAHLDLPVIEIEKFGDLAEAYKTVLKMDDIETICIDSLSEVAELVLAQYKTEERDPRKAYGRMADDMMEFTRGFKRIDKHIVVTAKQALYKDEYTGRITYIPAMPGQAYTHQVPYLFDFVFCMRAGKKGKSTARYLQTQPDINYSAKSRGEKLSVNEEPNLTELFEKIGA